MEKQMILKKFPFISKIRKYQNYLCFYLKMYLDSNHYSKTIQKEELAYSLKEFKDKMLNTRYRISYKVPI